MVIGVMAGFFPNEPFFWGLVLLYHHVCSSQAEHNLQQDWALP